MPGHKCNFFRGSQEFHFWPVDNNHLLSTKWFVEPDRNDVFASFIA